MAIPIGDDNSDRRTTPVVNYLLIALNIFVFIFWQQWGFDTHFTYAFVTVPKEIFTGTDIMTNSQQVTDPLTGQAFELPGLQHTPIPVFFTLITSMFLHGGIAHIAGNMLYLWIFGDNVEDAMGHFRYLIFYLLCGVLAGLTQVFTTLILGQDLLVPSLGASGAISGVLGAYIVLFPGKGIHVWFFLFTAIVPALVVVGLWFLFQVVNGLGTLGGEESGSVAYAAHIGGFIFGLLLVKRFAKNFSSLR
jgi:membrane associated rhomboid family serine protease